MFGLFGSTSDDDAEHHMLDDLRDNPSSVDNNRGRSFRSGRDYGGSYRQDREWPPRSSDDERDTED